MPKADAAATALIGTTQKLPRIRQSIAKNMKFGLDTAAQLTTVMEVDVTRVAALRAKAKTGFAAREGVESVVPAVLRQGGARRRPRPTR